MKRITAIELHNFLAFFDTDNKISLSKGENLLLYGENGSGKSSLCRALEVFFEVRLHPQFDIHQRNIWATSATDAPTDLRVTFDKTTPTPAPPLPDAPQTLDMKTASGTTWIEESRLASGFLTYRDILKTHFLENTRRNLFDLVNEILRGVVNPKSGIILSEKWAEISGAYNGLNSNIDDDFKRIEQDESGEAITLFNIIVRNIDEIKALTEDFNSEFEILIDTLNDKIDEFLSIFEQNIHLKLDVNNHTYGDGRSQKGLRLEYKNLPAEGNTLNDLRKQPNTPEDDKLIASEFLQYMELQKPLLTAKVDFFGRTIPEHQTFLNEARLSALAICIFLAALRLKPDPPDGCKMLFLDDVFIGLDSGNRLPLLKLLRTHFTDFQVMVSTHDRAWFEVAREHLPKNDWKWTAFYTEVKNEPTRVFEHPLIIDPALDYLGKAHVYFRKKDYPACANYQRKWCEQFIKNYLQDNYRLELSKNEGALAITSLDTLFGKLKQFYKDCSIKFPQMIKEEFDLHRDTVMNPFSHDNLHSPVYKQELERGFRLIEELEKLKPLRKSVIAYRGDIIEYVEPRLNYICRFQITTEPLSMINHGGDFSFLGRGDVLDFTENGTTKPAPRIGMKDLEVNDFCAKITHHLAAQNDGFVPNPDQFEALVLNPKKITLRQIAMG
jgi:energy-coupling factor transporter ATP-binding protein EcfA2